MTFRVVTYNVLATAYVRPDWYAGVPAELLRPEHRLPALVRHVEGLGADLLCLQEVEAEVFGALRGRLESLGYDGHYERKGRGKQDGCATFYRKGLFTPRAVRRLDYHDAGPGEPSGHLALLITLVYGGRLLGVANTHLRWDEPGKSAPEQVGYRQAVELLDSLCKFDPPCDGWIICGDFNRTPDGEVVAALREAGFEFAHAGLHAARSCVANRQAQLIDYLFHSPSLRSQALEPPPVSDATLLPSQERPSDHLALIAEFEWK